MLALAAAAFAGFYLPGLVRLGLVVVGLLGVRQLGRLPEGPRREALQLAAALVLGWLTLAWGLGLLSPLVATGFAALGVALGVIWWRYRGAIPAEAITEESPPPPRPLTPDEQLDEILECAPLEGMAFAEIVNAMAPAMSRSTVAAKLRARAWKLGGGRWRAKPRGVEGT